MTLTRYLQMCMYIGLCAPIFVQYSKGDDSIVAVVYGKVITRSSLEKMPITQVILPALCDSFDKEHGIIVTDEERNAFADKMVEAISNLPLKPPVPLSKETYLKTADRWIKNYKRNKLLYELYGGKVIFQQAGIEPIDAYYKWLQSEEAKGSFSFSDATVRTAFYDYYAKQRHIEVPTKDIDFSKPWWLMKKKE